MKSSILALVALLALVHGSQAATLVKRDVQSDVDKITSILKEMSSSFSAATQDMVGKVQGMEMTQTAQEYVNNGKAQFQPLVDKLQAEAAKLQEQMKPLTDSLSAQVEPLGDMMEKLFQQMVEQTKALIPAQPSA